MRKLGCLVVLVALVVAAWLFRGSIRRAVGGGRGDTAVAAGPTWEPLTREGAERARAAIARLREPRGPLYVNVSAGDLTSYIYQQLARQLPPSADSIEAAAFGERLYVRASVKLDDLGGAKVLGPLAGFLGERERMQFGGGFHIIRPGLAEFRVEEIRLRDFSVPAAMIPRILRQIERGSRPAGLAENGLPLLVPADVGDVRVQTRKVTLYKSTP